MLVQRLLKSPKRCVWSFKHRYPVNSKFQLLDQLAVGGKIVLPLGYPSSELAVLRKDADGQLHNEPMELKVSYVPLTDAAKQLSNA